MPRVMGQLRDGPGAEGRTWDACARAPCRPLLVAARRPSLSRNIFKSRFGTASGPLGSNEIVLPCAPLVLPLCCLSSRLQDTCAEGSP